MSARGLIVRFSVAYVQFGARINHATFSQQFALNSISLELSAAQFQE